MKSKRLRNLLRFGCAVRWTGPADGLADTGRVVCEGRGGFSWVYGGEDQNRNVRVK
jgi:hypothetical protein